MNERRVSQALSAHADALIGRPEADRKIDLADTEREQLAPLFQLAERLHQNMPPVQPSAAFVRSLGQELVSNAKHQVVLARRLRKAILIGAAAIGSLLSIASLVGAIVFVIVRWRERAHARAIQAPTG
jgi:hypothetical protein